MKIRVIQHTSTFPEVLIVPIQQNESLVECLNFVSGKTGVPVSILEKDFEGKLKEIQTLYFKEAEESKKIVLVGIGDEPNFADILTAFRSFCFKKKNILPHHIGIYFAGQDFSVGLKQMMEAAVNGLLLGRYDIGLYKTNEKDAKPFLNGSAAVDLYVREEDSKKLDLSVERGLAIAETQLEIFNLVNAPSNKKTPQTLANWAKQSGEKYGFKVEVFEKKKIEDLGLNALLAVNRGSEFPPTFIVMEYKPEQEDVPKVGLVGKGVTFDTGGLSIKPSNNMHYMKSDMGGAAAVMGAMELTAKLKLPVHLIGVVPATDNSVDAMSIKPSDVIKSYSGKTIEIIDTDAEGRLILADGLAYVVKNYQPDILIDLATLTGSCIRTLGTLAGGLFSKNEELADRLLQASKLSGERLWRLPLWDDYHNYIKSDVADVKNFSGIPAAGAITAAKFLEFFTDKHPTWAHLDIAGVAVSDSEFSKQKSATAFGVRLLIEYLSAL